MPSSLLYNSEASKHETRSLKNMGAFQVDRNLSRTPENVITIFSVNPLPQYSASGKRMFAACPRGQRYIRVGSLNDPFYTFDALAIDGQPGQYKTNPDDGEWVAMDWLNPENVYKLDQDFVVPGQVDYSTDLLQRGVFYIKRPYNPAGNDSDSPTDEEIIAAENRLKRRRQALVQLYNRTSVSSPKDVAGIMNEEMVDALNFAGVVTPYNSSLQEKVVCPNCGDMKMAAAKFHRSESLGVICIEPSMEGWQAALRAGLKTREEIPEEFQIKRGPGRPIGS